jgi:hypothetical protein
MAKVGIDINTIGGAINYSDKLVDIGADHFLKDGDLVIYSKGNLLNSGVISGLKEGATYKVDVDEANPTRIRLLDPDSDEVIDLKFSIENISFFDHKLTIVNPVAVKLAATPEDVIDGRPLTLQGAQQVAVINLLKGLTALALRQSQAQAHQM